MQPARAKAATIALQRDAFTELCRQRGLDSDAAIAMIIGVDRSQVWRVRTGAKAPGERFIAGVLRAWPEVRFEHIFRIVDMRPHLRTSHEGGPNAA